MELEAKRALFTHLSDEALEQYAFGRLPADQLVSFETHLLHCEHCQKRLDAEDNFAEAMHVLAQGNESATEAHSIEVDPSPAIQHASNGGFWTRLLPAGTSGLTPAWGAALVVIFVAGICAWRIPLGGGSSDGRSTSEPQSITLTTLRGGSAEGAAEAQAERPLDLTFNIANIAGNFAGNTPGLATSVSERGAYRLEIVDAAGEQRWAGSVSPTGSAQITARVDQHLGKGTYWVRLYSPSGKLLREFGLHLS